MLYPVIAGCNKGSSDSSQGPPTSISYEEHTITPQGGTYSFSEGFTLIVPAGAVASDTVIQMRRVGNNELASIYSARGVSSISCAAVIEGKPDG